MIARRGTILKILCLLCINLSATCAFTAPTSLLQTKLTSSSTKSNTAIITYSSRKNDNENKGTQSVAAGALLGGLLGGPFGLFFGASIGANLGKKYQVEKAQKDEMERLGITPEMLQMAEECGIALERAMEGLDATRESLDSLQKLARRLDQSNEDIYSKAQKEIVNGNEEEARKLLLERQNVQEKLMKTLVSCKDEKVRFDRMQQNVEAIEERAMEVDSLLKRTVGAKAFQDSSDSMSTMGDFRIEDEDPLLRKFKDLEKE